MPALDPNAQIRPDEIIDDPELFPQQLPQGVSKSTDYYVIKKQLADGRVVIEWYKRGPKLPEGQAPQDPVVARSQDYSKVVADEYAKEQNEQGTQSQRTIQRAGHTWQWNPQTNGYDIDLGTTAAEPSKGPPGGKPYLDEEGPNGRRLGWNPETQQYDRDLGASGAAKPQTTTGEDLQPVKGHPGMFQVTRAVKDAQGNTRSVTAYVDASGNPVPGPSEPAQAVSAPSNQKWIAQRNATTGEVEFVRNQNYVPDSKLITDPTTGRMRVLTEDENGNPVLKDLDDRTTIKPADIPVLQAKYGQIGQSLGAYLQDLNGRVSRGEITSQERDAAFKTAHQQAETQVSEINSILENSKTVWSTQIAERNQQYGEAATRRSYAGSIMNNAVSTGRGIAEGALPGSGRAIAEGVMTLMDLGQRYAQGMGGFPSMQSIAPPPALQQAASMNLPGFGPEAAGAPPATGGPPAPGTAGAPSAVGPVGAGITATTAAAVDPTRANIDAANSAVGAGSRSAFGALGIPGPQPAPLLPPPPPVPGQAPVAPPVGLAPAVGGPTPSPLPFTGQNPNPTPLGALGSQFGAGMAGSPIGVPQAAGGGGFFDRNQEAEAMLAASMTGGYGGAGVADPEWERAVRAAMGMVG